jgi:prepilin-type N-terminal cleavage/methylation domain-containing protein
MHKRALTLLEVLIVVAIVLLISAILLPVYLNSRKSAYAASCTSNLRQLSFAWTMYADSHDGAEPRNFIDLFGTVTDYRVFICPIDSTKDGANIDSLLYGHKVSYFSLDPPTDFRRAIEEADSNYGVFVCVLHGRQNMHGGALNSTTGLVLRARKDSSVQRAQVGHICVDGANGGIGTTRSTWTLFTDAWPCPEPWCPAGSYRCD